jgi:hypothetical protein
MTLDIRKLFSSGAMQGPNPHIKAWGGCMRPVKCRPAPWWVRVSNRLHWRSLLMRFRTWRACRGPLPF